MDARPLLTAIAAHTAMAVLGAILAGKSWRPLAFTFGLATVEMGFAFIFGSRTLTCPRLATSLQAFPFQKSGVPQSYGLTVAQCERAARVISPNGRIYQEAQAVNAALDAILATQPHKHPPTTSVNQEVSSV